jgi:hypothetical protein
MMTAEQLRSLLAESACLLVEFKEIPLMDQVELTRRWERVRGEALAEARTFLEKYTSANNASAIAAGTPQYFVDDPLVDGRPMPGRWRLVSVMDSAVRQNAAPREEQIAQGVVQILRRGFATQLHWDEAQAGERQENVEEPLAKVRTVRFVNLDPSSTQSIAGELTASLDSLTLSGETLVGPWYLVGTRIYWADDGSGVIEARYATIGYQWAAEEWAGALVQNSLIYYKDVPQQLVQGIVSTYSAQQDAGVEVNIQISGAAQGLFDLTISTTTTNSRSLDFSVGVEEESIEDISMRWNLTLAELTAFKAPYELPEANKEKSVTVQLNRNDTYDVVGRVKKASNDIASFGATIGSEWNVSTRIEWRWGLDDGDLAIFCLGYAVSEPGKSKRVSLNRRQDGRYDVIGTVETITENASPLSAIVGSAWDTQEYIEWRWALSQSAVDAFTAGYAVSEEGKRKSISVNRRQDGFFDVVGRVEITTDNPSPLSATIGASWDTTEQIEWRWGLTSAALSTFLVGYQGQEDGKQKSVSVNRRQDGKFDVVGRIATTTVISDTVTISVGSAWDTVETTVWRWAMTEAELLAFSATYSTKEEGKQKSVNVNRRSDGKFDAVARVSETDPVDDLLAITVGAAWDTSEATTWRWGLSKAEVEAFAAGYSSQVDGQQKSVSINRRADGKFDAVGRVSSTAISSYLVTATVGSAWDTEETTVWVWGLTVSQLADFTADYSAREDGKQKSVSVSRRGDGKFDAVGRVSTTDITVEDFTITVGTAWDTTEVTLWKWGLAKADAEAFAATYSVPESGKQKSVNVNRRNDGLFDVVGRTATTDPAIANLDLTVGSAWDTSEAIAYRWGLDDAGVAAFALLYSAQEDGKQKSISVNRRGDGLFDAVGRIASTGIVVDSVSVTLGAAWDTSEQIEWRWGLSKAELDAFAADYSTQEDGKSKSLTLDRRTDGKFNVVGRVSTVAISVDTLTAVIGSAWDTTETITWKWGISQAELDAFAALYSAQEEGKTKSISLNRRGDGKFDAVGRVSTTSIATDTVVATVGAAWDTVETTTWKWGLTKAQLDAFTALYSASADGSTKSVSVSRRADGKFDAVGRESLQTDDTPDEVVKIAVAWATDEQITWKWGLTSTELATFEASHQTAVDGTTKSFSVTRRADGLFDVVLRENISQKPFDDVTMEVKRQDAETVSTTWKWGMTKTEFDTWHAELKAGVTAGVVRNVSVQRREDNLYDATMVEATQGARVGISGSSTKQATSTRDLYFNQATPITKPAGYGDYSSIKNELGLYDGHSETISYTSDDEDDPERINKVYIVYATRRVRRFTRIYESKFSFYVGYRSARSLKQAHGYAFGATLDIGDGSTEPSDDAALMHTEAGSSRVEAVGGNQYVAIRVMAGEHVSDTFVSALGDEGSAEEPE